MSDLLAELGRDRTVLAQRQAEADRVIAASGAGHLVHEMNRPPGDAGGRPWRIDPVPLLLDSAVFDELATIVRGRMEAFERILGDLYGPRQLIRDAAVAAEALSSSERYRMGAVGAPSPVRWLTTFAVDFVELADGTWRIVADLTDNPTGVGYALLDRSVMLRVADGILGATGASEVTPIGEFPTSLRHALIDNTSVDSPRVVIYTGGVASSGYVEQSWLARTLGFTLVERPDLVVRQGRVYLRTLGGLAAVDVVHRGVEDGATDPVAVGGSGGGEGVPGLLAAAGDGNVALANAYGAGVIEDPSLTEFWHEAALALTGAALPGVRLVGDGAELAHYQAFQRGDVGTTAAVVRMHAVAGPDGVTVMPGGNGRVLAVGDDPRRPTAQRAKDVWVVGEARPVSVVSHVLPQVDFTESVPTRAADALYWAGRAAERAEAIARTARAVATRRRIDPGLVNFDDGKWTAEMIEALRGVRGLAFEEATEQGGDDGSAPPRPVAALEAELAASTRALVSQLRAFVGEAATVGEFLPANTSRTLNALMVHAEALGDRTAPIDTIDEVLAGLAAFRGMWSESTVRGPAWRFGDIGFRLQRALSVLELAAACVVGRDGEGEQLVLSASTTAAIEVLLNSAELLIAYRRQYRSDIDTGLALDLLLRDSDNPGSYRSSLERIAEHATDVGWTDGATTAIALLDELGSGRLTERRFYDRHRQVIGELSGRLVEQWFATPAKPILVRAVTVSPAAPR